MNEHYSTAGARTLIMQCAGMQAYHAHKRESTRAIVPLTAVAVALVVPVVMSVAVALVVAAVVVAVAAAMTLAVAAETVVKNNKQRNMFISYQCIHTRGGDGGVVLLSVVVTR